MFTPEEGESEPEWVTTERKHFSEYRDNNKVCSITIIKDHMTFMTPRTNNTVDTRECAHA